MNGTYDDLLSLYHTSDFRSLSSPQDSFRFGQNIRQAMLDIRALFNQKEKKIWLLKSGISNSWPKLKAPVLQ